MATNAKIKSDIQSLNVSSEIISLYILDTSVLGGTTSYFIPNTNGTSTVVFGGIPYIPLPVEFTGMELTGDGRLPRPKMRVANVSSTFVGIINAYQDGLGAKVTRLRTLKKYLDGESSADSAAQLPRDIFYIEQKTDHNDIFIEWELVSPLDIGTKMIPRNQVISYCQHRYRFYENGTLNYSNATCTYYGSNYFKEDGSSTPNASEDKCGKKLYDCELRFGAKGVLPMKGFPGVGNVARAYR